MQGDKQANVWCKVVGEGGQDAVEPKRIVATIGKAPLTITIPTAAKTYNGKAQTQAVKVTGNKAGKAAQTLLAGTDYDVKYANNVNAAGNNNYNAKTVKNLTYIVKVNKAANPIKVTAKAKSFKVAMILTHARDVVPDGRPRACVRTQASDTQASDTRRCVSVRR